MRQLQDHLHHIVAAQHQRGPRLQRVRSLLQTAQCEYTACTGHYTAYTHDQLHNVSTQPVLDTIQPTRMTNCTM